MLATQTTHSPCCECDEENLLFQDTSYEQISSSQLSKGSSRHSGNSRIVSLSDEIVLIKGTLSIAF